MGFARERLHEWFREKDGTLPYGEIRRRLKSEFGLTVSIASLSRYYSKHGAAINAEAKKAAAIAPPKTIVIRIEVPAGCRIDVSTETEGAEEPE